MKQGAPQYFMVDYIEIQALLSEYELPRGNSEMLSITDVIDLPHVIDGFKDGYGVISEINFNDIVPSEPYYSLNTVLSLCELQLVSGDLI